jgi:hypothetical protein
MKLCWVASWLLPQSGPSLTVWRRRYGDCGPATIKTPGNNRPPLKPDACLLYFGFRHLFFFIYLFFARFEVLTAMAMKRSVFCDIMLCSPVKVNWRFERICCLHLQARRASKGRNENEAGGEPVKVITTSIPVNRMARRLEGNIGKYAVVGSVTARGERWEGRVGIMGHLSVVSA